MTLDQQPISKPDVSPSTAQFDGVAGQYDADFTDTPLGRRQRAIVHCYLQQVVRPDFRILELNCGTGEDALWLAERSAEVVATDVSDEMLRVARAKAIQQHSNGHITFRNLDLNALRSDAIRDELGTFDLIFSDFDGINCLRDIAWLPAALQRLLTPGGHVILVFMNPICGMEILACLAAGRFRRAFTRLRREGASAHIGNGKHVQTYFHPVGTTVRAFHKLYTLHHVEAIGLITPPTLLRDFYHRHEQFFSRMFPVEDRLAPLPVFNRLGDHVLIHAQLNNA